jgi:hypothetical protein
MSFWSVTGSAFRAIVRFRSADPVRPCSLVSEREVMAESTSRAVSMACLTPPLAE